MAVSLSFSARALNSKLLARGLRDQLRACCEAQDAQRRARILARLRLHQLN